MLQQVTLKLAHILVRSSYTILKSVSNPPGFWNYKQQFMLEAVVVKTKFENFVEFLNFGVLEKSHHFCAKYIRETAL